MNNANLIRCILALLQNHSCFDSDYCEFECIHCHSEARSIGGIGHSDSCIITWAKTMKKQLGC